MFEKVQVAETFSPEERMVVHSWDCLEFLKRIPDRTFQLVATSPPYNLGKEYERRIHLDDYIRQQKQVIRECVRVLKPTGSVCWQVGNHVDKGMIIPLDVVLFPIFRDLGLQCRNRIVWHFEHGLHCRRRFSGRYESVLWFTKGRDHAFDLDAVRVPQKYPGKRAWKGPRAGEYTGNPLGKNPGDVWIFPNVKANHVEKTIHPCQFPVELVERFILTLTQIGDLVVDPFMGVGTTACAAVMHRRRVAGPE